MYKSLSIFILFLLLGCSASPPKQTTPPPSVLAALSSVECGTGDFRGQGVEASEQEALNTARSAIAQQIQSSVRVQQTQTQNQTVTDGRESLSSSYAAKTVIEAALSNAHDARVMRIERGVGEVGAVLCMSRSDAAKGFVERLRPVAASLEFAANAAIEEKHPRLKSEAWQKTQQIYNEFTSLYSMVQGLDKEKAAPFEPVATLYEKAKGGYLSYCQTAKLYWNPEQDNPYSEVAFSKLSKNLKLEKASCKGHGISLVYKNTGHECRHSGMFRCSHKPSMLIASCYGEEYRLLENPNVEVFQNVEEVALRKLREKLEYEYFWNEWEQEIKQWKSICE